MLYFISTSLRVIITGRSDYHGAEKWAQFCPEPLCFDKKLHLQNLKSSVVETYVHSLTIIMELPRFLQMKSPYC